MGVDGRTEVSGSANRVKRKTRALHDAPAGPGNTREDLSKAREHSEIGRSYGVREGETFQCGRIAEKLLQRRLPQNCCYNLKGIEVL